LSTKFGNRFRNLWGIKSAKRYSYSFKFDIFIARCLGGPFFTGHSVVTVLQLYLGACDRSNRSTFVLSLSVFFVFCTYCE